LPPPRVPTSLSLLIPLSPGPSLPRRLPRAAWQEGRVLSQITHPSRLVGQSSGGEVPKHQLDTRVRHEPGGGGGGPGLHLAQVSFMVRAFGSAFTLDLRLNHPEPWECGTGQPPMLIPIPAPQGAGEHCYYQGRIRGQPRSFAALSSCQGLRGVFSDGRATYLIEPQAGAEHGQVRACCSCLELWWGRIPTMGWLCRLPASQPSPEGSGAPSRLSRGFPLQVRRAQHTVHSETKYIELAVVNDHQLFLQLRKSVVLTSNFAKSVVNLADMIYKEQLNTRIVLVAMETWAAEDRIRVGQDPLETLNEFVKYRREGLAEHSDTVHLFSGYTFQSSRSGTAFVGGICSAARACGVNEYGNVAAMAVTLAQTLGQNVGMMWNKHRTAAGDCRCPDSWLGCIMEDTGYYLPRKFSRCSIDEYNQFLQDGGGSCLFNKPLKVTEPPRPFGVTQWGPMLRGSLEVSPAPAELPEGWLGVPSSSLCVSVCPLDVLCGFLLCANISGSPRLGELSGEIATTTFYHQNRYVDCRGGHVQLVDGSDLSYVEDGTPCGPGMLCLDRKCLPATAFNFSSCPGSWDGKICFDHGVCSNEGKCICRAEWTGKDCSVYDPIPEPKPTGETERYKGPSGTNIIIGSIAGAVLVAAIVLGGTGWGFKNIRRGRYDPAQQGV
uniref:ADAM metallopeptidase domain 11 n=1 Tax=Junco hyemalis TaxID=40217 RepID=A0A8C5IX79_JUNHY